MKRLDDEFIGDQEFLRQVNLSTVLAHLRQNAPVSRASLAEMTGLNRATITRLVRELIAHGFVREAGFHSLHAGRPSILLQLDPDAGCIIGAEIEAGFGSVVLTDLSAGILWRQELDFGESDHPYIFLNHIADLVREACSIAGNRHILGLGLSLPGHVDVSNGVLLFAPRLPWSDLQVKHWMAKEFQLPIYIDNKANMAALAEVHFGSARHSRFVVYLHMTVEVSAGIVFNRRLLRGASGLAGEVGHMIINPDGPRCDCGNLGCWETYVSTAALVRRVRESILMGKKTRLVELVRDQLESITVPLLLESARDGDEVALASFEETGFYLGIGIANLINLLNPEKVVLGGYVAEAYEFLLPVIQKTVQERALRWPLEGAEIVTATHGNDASLMGAVATVYDQILSNPNRAFRAKEGLERQKEVIAR